MAAIGIYFIAISIPYRVNDAIIRLERNFALKINGCG